MTKKIILITGAGSGLGNQLAIQLAESGHIVYAGTRNIDKSKKGLFGVGCRLDNLKIIKLDIAKDDSVKNAIKQILSHEYRIDILINNAGYGIVGAMENISIKKMQDLLNINLFGAIRCIQKVLPSMRKNNIGCIVNISSVSGVVASPFLGVYSASKFALEGLTESLSLELFKYNIRVVLVEPGLLKSKFLKNSVIINPGKSNVYFKDVFNYIKLMKAVVETEKGQDLAGAAEMVLDIIFSDKSELRYQTNKWSKKIVRSKLRSNIINKKVNEKNFYI